MAQGRILLQPPIRLFHVALETCKGDYGCNGQHEMSFIQLWVYLEKKKEGFPDISNNLRNACIMCENGSFHLFSIIFSSI